MTRDAFDAEGGTDSRPADKAATTRLIANPVDATVGLTILIEQGWVDRPRCSSCEGGIQHEGLNRSEAAGPKYDTKELMKSFPAPGVVIRSTRAGRLCTTTEAGVS